MRIGATRNPEGRVHLMNETHATGFERLSAALRPFGHGFAVGPCNAEALEVAAELRLPERVIDDYRRGGPLDVDCVVPWAIEGLDLFPLGRLPHAQAGYRWWGDTRRRLEDWPESWVVVASASADPFFVDVGDPDLPVHFARHGEGAWRPARVAPTFDLFFDALIAYEAVFLGEFGGDVLDDDSEPDPRFAPALAARLGAVLPAPEASVLLTAATD